MGNQHKRSISAETEFRVMEQWGLGKVAKQIAHDLGISLWIVYHIRDKLPLFCNPKDD